MKTLVYRLCVLVIAVAFAVPAAGGERPAAPPDLDAYVARAMRQFEVPGVGLAIVKDGRVVLAKGYGVRALGENAPVDAKTLFAIASNTKAFTTTAIGILVEEGKLEWDAPVIRYLPWFRLADPYVTSEITVRDLLVHRSGLGLGAGDLLMWPPTTYDRTEIVRRLRFIPLATSFRYAYAYDNVLYLVAGELIEAVSGLTWEDFITTRIFAKVGMTGSTARYNEPGAGRNIAAPHAVVEGVLRRVEPFPTSNDAPAGGINANAEDMARWLITQIDSGRVGDGPPLFTPATTRELWSVVTPLPVVKPDPELAELRMDFAGYGLGLGILQFRGRKLVTHTGGLVGYVSRVAMIPELRLGVAVLTNQESASAFNSIVDHVLDYYTGAPPKDWIAAYVKVKARADSTNAATVRAAVTARDTLSRPSLPLVRYAGTYTDAWYGDVTIAAEQGTLVVRFSRTPSLVGDIEHWQYDTFIARWRDRTLRADAYVTFDLNPDGSIDRVRMKPVSPETDFSFDFQDLVLKPAGK